MPAEDTGDDLVQGTTVSTADAVATPSPDVQSTPAAATTQTPAASTPAATTPAQTTPAPTTPETGQAADANAQTTGAAATAQAQAAGYPNVRAYLKALGYQNADQYQDDESAIQSMYSGYQTTQQQLAEAKRMATYGQLWLDQQSKAAQTPAAPAADPLAAFKAPEFDPRWESQLIVGADGALSVKPGGDPTILPKYMAYRQHRDKIGDQFLQDPVAFISKIVEHSIPKQTQEVVEKRLAMMQEEQFANNFMQANAKFLYQHDVAGQIVRNNATGQPVMSQDGMYFAHCMKYANDRFGITDSARQVEFAQMALQARAGVPAAATAAAVQTGQQQQANVLNNLNRNPPNRSGSFVGQDTGHLAPDTQNSGLSLREQLTAAFKQGGITSEAIASEPS